MKTGRHAYVLALCILFAASVACQFLTGGSSAPAATPEAATLVPVDAAEPTQPPAPTARPKPTATEDPCVLWSDVTVGMKGERVCFRGIITKFDQTRQLGTRYSFSDKSGTVFLYSIKYEIIDPNTGKTIAPGTCVEIVGPLRVEGDRPAIYLDPIMDDDSGDSGYFYFYDDKTSCQ